MKYLILILLVSCGVQDPISKDTRTTKKTSEVDKLNNEITIIINNPKDDIDKDNLESLPILFVVCKGIIVEYEGDLFYIEDNPKRIKQSWTKVQSDCRLRIGFNTVEEQEKIDNKWIFVD